MVLRLPPSFSISLEKMNAGGEGRVDSLCTKDAGPIGKFSGS